MIASFLSRRGSLLKNIGVLAFWLLVWEAAAAIVGSSIIVVSPRVTFVAFVALVQTGEFWHSVANSITQIGKGFLLAFVCGVAIAVIAARFKLFYTIILPAINVLNAVPFASFVVIALFAMGASSLAMFVPFVMVLPIFFHNTYKGIKTTSPQLLEMAKVFNVPYSKRVLHIYAKSARGHVVAAAQVGIGFAWKSGIGAELIGQVRGTIGGNLHIARIHLQTANLFAWTITIVLLSYALERLIVFALGGNSSGN